MKFSMKNQTSKLVTDFSLCRSLYQSFSIKMEELIKNILTESNVKVHSVTSRTKSIKDFSEKISRSGKNYSNFREVTDLTGIRIICLFSEQLDRIAEIIKENFIILPHLSVDKRQIIDPDRFGYLSLHYIVKLPEERTMWPEYKRYVGLLCEIQIRSILQHAWAEIEHDLGYKSDIVVPRDIKRRFYRLAGLLELADDEFNHLQTDIKDYDSNVEDKIKSSPQKILIDKISLEKFVKTSDLVRKLDEEIAKIMKAKLSEKLVLNGDDFKSLKLFNIRTIEDLNKTLEKNFEKIIKFAKIWITSEYDEVDRAISIFYLNYTLAVISGDNKRISDFVNLHEFADNSKVKKDLIKISTEFNKI